MKRLKKYLMQGFCTLAACYGTAVSAQAVFTDYVTINKNTVLINNLSILDSMGSQKKMIHTAAFDITISNGKDVQQVLQYLSACMQAGKEMDIRFSKFNNRLGKVAEERFYYGATLQQMMVPAFNAALKSAVKLRIFISGVKANVVMNPASDMVVPKPEKVANAVVSNFRFVLGTLPTNRVRLLQGMTIVTGPSAGIATAAELSLTDNAAWSQAFSNGTGQGIPEGRIEMLTPNFKDVIATIYLYNTRLTSFRSNSGSNTISTVTYGLVVDKISLEAGKR